MFNKVSVFLYSFFILLYAETIIRYTGLNYIILNIFVFSFFLTFIIYLFLKIKLLERIKMNKILIKYLFNNYIKTFLKVFFIFYCFGIILNLFEEIEFF